MLAALAATATVLLAACGNGGGGSALPSRIATPLPTSSPAQSASVTYRITVPRGSTTGTSAHGRRAQYVSPNTSSIVVSLLSHDGVSLPTPTKTTIAITGPSCTTSGSVTTCTAVTTAPVGTDTFDVSTFASTDGSGTALSRGTAGLAVTFGSNTLYVTLAGVVASLAWVGSPTATAGVASAAGIALNALDPSGATIVGQGGFLTPAGNADTITLACGPHLALQTATGGALGTTTIDSPSANTIAHVAFDGAQIAATTLTCTATDAASLTATLSDVIATGSGNVGVVVDNPLTISPSPLSATIGTPATFTASEPSYTGPYTETDNCSAVGTIAAASASSWTITAANGGTCVATVKDNHGGTASVTITASAQVASFSLQVVGGSGAVLGSANGIDVIGTGASGRVQVTALDSGGNPIAPQPPITATPSNPALVAAASVAGSPGAFTLTGRPAGRSSLRLASGTATRDVPMQTAAQTVLYAANNGGVDEYFDAATTVSTTMPNTTASALALDSGGNLYAIQNASTYSSTLAFYGPGATTPYASLNYSQGIVNPNTVAVGHAGEVYVCNGGDGGAQAGNVSVFAAASATPLRTISIGQHACYAAVLDASGNLYVAVDGTDVNVYPSGSGTPSRTIANVNGSLLAVDPSGKLYAVQNDGSITVYAPGASSPSATLLVGTETSPIAYRPAANGLAVDANGNVYLAYMRVDTSQGFRGPTYIAVFAPGATSPTRSISSSQQILGLAVVPSAAQ